MTKTQDGRLENRNSAGKKIVLVNGPLVRALAHCPPFFRLTVFSRSASSNGKARNQFVINGSKPTTILHHSYPQLGQYLFKVRCHSPSSVQSRTEFFSFNNIDFNPHITGRWLNLEGMLTTDTRVILNNIWPRNSCPSNPCSQISFRGISGPVRFRSSTLFICGMPSRPL